MTLAHPEPTAASAKAPTGVIGIDKITGGGLPRGRTTLLVGRSGAGKTVLALQFLAHGARHCKEPGIFVAFEESPQRILANAASFGWGLDALVPKRLFFVDAQPLSSLVQSGDFDLGGMLAALEVQTRVMRARRIVFDALDVAMERLPDLEARKREIYRLHEWLLAHQLTAVLTVKAGVDETNAVNVHPFGFMQFMADCSVLLNQRMVLGLSQRTLRVLKYRGSSFDEDESPFSIGSQGLEVRTRIPEGSAP